MKLTSIFNNSRKPQNVNKVPFKAMMSLVLKDYVTTKDYKVADRGCLHEMSMLLSCLEENEYEDKNCIPQFNSFNACFNRFNHNLQTRKIQSGKKMPVPNSNNHTPLQITSLLRKFPTK
ncbi:PREDICTED: coiled-coil-helix-coiled-coil-helix domain-containing protein 1 [Dinoponera quadriceps]|uniref:Coiled-coil-helix-coiled-coil-helix domain-containing protein 1 n=1 Tax=Dinoponera quadriceps TaxID=609295 RepID=A0A6P3WZQ9_DINQU|nr:PREDICTED: coiled-coil-helix-coiled-coil-helix domain-containing protein 1 [Dinoponera quadriceps]XP_014471408.1 PREDICTED: coiled-coil-helix-coiled-coil-helix domain-containing protein 1 [Dinoponera quadriceps]